MPPKLVGKKGEPIKMASLQDKLSKLTEKRGDIQKELDIIDTEILELKKTRQEELMAELKALGLDVVAPAKAKTATGRKPREEKGPRKCQICVGLGLPGIGHNSRSHDKFMAEQKTA